MSEFPPLKATLPPTNMEVEKGPFQEESRLSTGVCAPTHDSWWEGSHTVILIKWRLFRRLVGRLRCVAVLLVY